MAIIGGIPHFQTYPYVHRSAAEVNGSAGTSAEVEIVSAEVAHESSRKTYSYDLIC